MLTLQHLAYRYAHATTPITADFRVTAGQGLALMGASGAGKTTLLNLIAGLLTPHRGDIQYQGTSLIPLPPAQRPLSYLYQAHNLFPHLTVRDNVAIGLAANLKLNAGQEQQLHAALFAVGLPNEATHRPAELSGGQQQRVAIARSLLRNRPILLLDEPFAGLDPKRRTDIITLINTLQAQHRFILILATHAIADAQALNARVYPLD